MKTSFQTSLETVCMLNASEHQLRTTLQTGCLGCFWTNMAVPGFPWKFILVGQDLQNTFLQIERLLFFLERIIRGNILGEFAKIDFGKFVKSKIFSLPLFSDVIKYSKVEDFRLTFEFSSQLWKDKTYLLRQQTP